MKFIELTSPIYDRPVLINVEEVLTFEEKGVFTNCQHKNGIIPVAESVKEIKAIIKAEETTSED